MKAAESHRRPSLATRTLLALSLAAGLGSFHDADAAAVWTSGAGDTPAEIQAVVDQFRTELGAQNPNNGQSFPAGRREVNWDGVPDNFASPNFFPNTFFQVNSPRGLVYNTVGDRGGENRFLVSADSANPTNTAVRFGDIDPGYTNIFQTFSPQRLFIARGTTATEVVFFVPGTDDPAYTNAFGVVFADVDDPNGTMIRLFDPKGLQIGALAAPARSNGLSFLGVRFDAGEKIARVVITSGNAPLQAGNTDGFGGVDVVAMDDFIYGEPQSIGRFLFDGFE